MRAKLFPISLFLLIYCAMRSRAMFRMSRDVDSLIMAHVIFRHGDRTPDPDALKYYPNNPYKNLTYFPYGNGQLTLRGKKRSYFLGESLRRRFERFFGPVYYPEILQAHSSEYDRCQMTMQLVLASLFPPAKQEEISRYLYWQPIPYKYFPFKEDKYLSIHKTCPKILQSKFEYDNKTLEMYKYVSEHVGAEIKSAMGLLAVQNTIQIQEELGFRVPYWARRIWPEPFTRNAMQAFVDITKNHLSELVGNLLNKIVEDTKAKISDVNSGLKLVLYSGHDLNIAGVLAALGAYHGQYISYTSHVIMEVHQINGAVGFKFFIHNYDTEYPKLIKVQDCGTFCTIQQFSELTDKYYKGDDWCAAEKKEEEEEEPEEKE